MHKSNCRGASAPLLDHDAIDATPARWRGVVVYYRSFQPARLLAERGLSEEFSTLICAQVELDELKDQKVLKKWFKLSEAEGRKGSVAGHVLLHVQWRHDPAIAFEPFSEDTSEKTPNELRIGLFKAVHISNVAAFLVHG